MDLDLYDKLSHFICTYARLDPFNYYFLGICYEHALQSMTLEKLFIQLSSSFSGFTKNSILKRINETKAPLNGQKASQNPKEGFSIIRLLKNEKNLKSLLDDFDILPRLFSKVSKAQWFYLGTFMAKNPSFDVVDFLIGKYFQLCVNLSKYKGEYSKANFLASLLKKALKSETMNIEPEPTTPKRKGKFSGGPILKDVTLSRSKASLRRKKQQTMEEEEEEEKVNKTNQSFNANDQMGVIDKETPEFLEALPCPICLDSMSEYCTIVLSNCQHSFHLICLQDYLQEMINGKRFPIRCAMDGCASLMLENEILENVDKDYQEKFEIFTLKHFVETHNPQVFCCPTANCEYFAFLDELPGRHFQCGNCEKRYCMECRKEWHDEMSCEQADFSEVAKKNGYQKCSSCHMYIEKNGGCTSMVCRCNYQFIWGAVQNEEYM